MYTVVIVYNRWMIVWIQWGLNIISKLKLNSSTKLNFYKDSKGEYNPGSKSGHALIFSYCLRDAFHFYLEDGENNTEDHERMVSEWKEELLLFFLREFFSLKMWWSKTESAYATCPISPPHLPRSFKGCMFHCFS